MLRIACIKILLSDSLRCIALNLYKKILKNVNLDIF